MGPIDISHGLDDDAVISRYMSFAAFASTLLSKKLFFNTVSQFEDKSEGAATLIDALVNSNTPALLDYAVNSLWPGTIGTSSKQTVESLEAKARKADLEKPLTFETPFGDYTDKAPALGYEGVLHKLRDWIDVACWHESVDESLAMWRIYGRTNEAVCITSTVGRLKRALRLADDMKCHIAKVHYINHEIDPFQTGSSFASVLHKMHAYEFEKEVRAIVWKPSSVFTERRESFGSLIDIDLPTLITGVRLSPDSKPWLLHLVRSMLDREGLRVPLSGSVLDRNPWKKHS